MIRNINRTIVLTVAVSLAGFAVVHAAPMTSDEHVSERMHDDMMPHHDKAVAERTEAVASAGDADDHEDEAERKHIAMTPEDVEWMLDPAALPPGARVAVLMGDPATEDPLAMRVILPSDYVIPPHTHPALEQGIVLSGTLHLGAGEHMDEDAAERLPAGSYFAIPPEHPHYAFTGDEPVVFQIQSMGPWEINYVDPADDPRHE